MLVLEQLKAFNIGIFSAQVQRVGPQIHTWTLAWWVLGRDSHKLRLLHTHTGLSSFAQFTESSGLEFPLGYNLTGPSLVRFLGLCSSMISFTHQVSEVINSLLYLSHYKLSYLCNRFRMLKIWSSSFQSDIFAGLPSVWTANPSGSPHLSRQ